MNALMGLILAIPSIILPGTSNEIGKEVLTDDGQVLCYYTTEAPKLLKVDNGRIIWLYTEEEAVLYKLDASGDYELLETYRRSEEGYQKAEMEMVEAKWKK
ncbi:hypothetical protein V6R21_07155 [Limibacter armeniacum]|uniref:hypothetical protein n=1 Tax=Limibacter armeniacum TaxID=466084 RepID=UPI002FE50340